MKKLEYIKALTEIDDEFVNEAATATKTVNITNKRKIALLVAAVMLVLLATGAGYVAATLLSVDVSTYGTIEATRLDIMEFDSTELSSYENDMISLIESEYGKEVADLSEYITKADRYASIRNEHLAKEYGVEYQDDVFHQIKEYDGSIIEVGSFYTVNNVFAYFHTDKRSMYSEIRIFVYLFNPETQESKLDYVILDRKGPYTVNVKSEEGWLIAGAEVLFCHEYNICGASSTFAWVNDETKKEYILANREIVNFTGDNYDELTAMIREISRERNSSDDFKWKSMLLVPQ